ncbi:uncharacterized protein LOC133421375 isoform X2 [Cololabis saira]|uniref:uncharacterized protein LOC133421375 isoform X2 n=1 Tax=Cololabis saira TaxID=129043 RepID=UPI002AD1E3AE|nr:uncharacterized protein LOC133421375 isoform X2 [Cololabis saira]
MTDDIFLTDSDIRRNRRRSDTKPAGAMPRRADGQRRRSRVFHVKTRKSGKVTKSMDDADLAVSRSGSSGNGSSRSLLRSYSCPEIPSLRPHDSPWSPPLHSSQHSRTHSSHHHGLLRRSLRRARRHTVCSVEVERELAPLCLRKEVYPSKRSAPVTQHLSGGHTHSPSTSLSALAACFLSSPLAFLSRRLEGRGAAESPSPFSCLPPSCSSSPTSQLSSPIRRSPGLIPKLDSGDILGSSCREPLPCNGERRQPSEEEDGEDTSSSSHEFEDVGLTEEKALSDSEIKVVQKHEEQRKVSSIRIRRTLPKPQTNLTPMGLPKPIRVKKKEFTLEEIYTNKNYSKPPESRLESIFEMPLTRRDGSEAWFGQRRVKRFLEFSEGGEARKPKKPLVGVGKVGISGSRTRRGSFSKDGPSLSAQDVDSLLCSKLDQLKLWLAHDQQDR